MEFKVQHKETVGQIVKGITDNPDLTKGDLFAIAKALQQATGEGIKDLGYHIGVRDFGDEKPGVKNAHIHKGYNEIEIDLHNSGKNPGENYITITTTTKDGIIKDVRVVFHLDDDYYIDNSPSQNDNVLVVKKRSEPTDAEILAKQYKPKHTYPHGKSMPRNLTEDEDRELVEFMQKNPKMDILEVIDVYEEKFGTLITQTHVTKLVIENYSDEDRSKVEDEG